jgi:hypothetical protein
MILEDLTSMRKKNMGRTSVLSNSPSGPKLPGRSSRGYLASPHLSNNTAILVSPRGEHPSAKFVVKVDHVFENLQPSTTRHFNPYSNVMKMNSSTVS